MEKSEIRKEIVAAHEELITHVKALSDEQFDFRRNGEKWNAGQELLHIIKTLKAVSKAFGMPKLALKVTFGTANRPSRSFDEIMKRYRTRSEEGEFVTTAPYEPEILSVGDRDMLIAKLREKVNELCDKLNRFSERDLDKYVVPHPLFGKLTLREMSFFAAYHAKHHLANSRRNLEAMHQAQ